MHMASPTSFLCLAEFPSLAQSLFYPGGENDCGCSAVWWSLKPYTPHVLIPLWQESGCAKVTRSISSLLKEDRHISGDVSICCCESASPNWFLTTVALLFCIQGGLFGGIFIDPQLSPWCQDIWEVVLRTYIDLIFLILCICCLYHKYLCCMIIYIA